MIQRLKTRLKAIPAGCRIAAEQAISETVLAAQAEAVNRVPVRSGRLKRSIRAESQGLAGAVYSGCDYAPSVELGGRGNPARPFLYPAAQAQRQAFPARAARAISKSLKGGK